MEEIPDTPNSRFPCPVYICARQGKPGAPDDALPEKRRSPMVEIATLIAECVQHNVRTLAFCMTRKLCELVVTYARDILRYEYIYCLLWSTIIHCRVRIAFSVVACMCNVR
jgi:ATP-dependent helicase YprA (DUF1998 family)